jgi:hypothetical protein
MDKWRGRCRRAAIALLAALPAMAAAPSGDRMVLVADSRRYTGLMAWWTNLYNENHFMLALATIITIPALGLVMAKLTDFVLARIGINLKSRVLAEH